MFNSGEFFVVIVVLYLGLSSMPQRYFGNVFGLSNLVAVSYLFSWYLTAVLVIFSLVLWSLLLFLKLSVGKNGIKKQIAALILVLLSALTLSLCFLDDLIRFFNFSRDLDTAWSFKFFTLVGSSYLALRIWDCSQAVLQYEKLLNPLVLSGYLLPFFMVMAGPIASYSSYCKSISSPTRSVKWPDFVDCVYLISLGFFLKYFLAEGFKLIIVGLDGTWQFENVFDTWLFLVFVFFEFSGYSLIAFGVGKLLGISTPKNFDRPYFAKTVGEFYRRWHISLGSFVARNLFNPISIYLMRTDLAKSEKTIFLSNLFALIVCFSFTGLWHHVSWEFLAWGILLGFIIAVENHLLSSLILKSFYKTQIDTR